MAEPLILKETGAPLTQSSKATSSKTPLINFLINIMTTIIALLIVYATLEISIRAIKGRLTDTRHIISTKIDVMKSVLPAIFDETLGWVPEPSAESGPDLWVNKTVTILENGLRSNGTPLPINPKGVIVAVGDSFTFGDEVSNHETWPAMLEQISGFQVLNGGVFSYGLDQSILRGKILTKKYSADLLIVSFVLDDIYRCTQSVRTSAAKPYFTIDQGELTLRNSPVPRLVHPDDQFDWFRKYFGYSYLMNSIVIRINPGYWVMGANARNVQAHDQGDEVAKKLLAGLSNFAADENVKIIVVAQAERKIDPDRISKVSSLISGIESDRVKVLNLMSGFYRILNEDRAEFRTLFQRAHASAKGNRLIAGQINNVINT